jgi:hypothetical protein
VLHKHLKHLACLCYNKLMNTIYSRFQYIKFIKSLVQCGFKLLTKYPSDKTLNFMMFQNS